MDCPACSNSLKPLEVSGVTVDACEGGCGGVWFDKYEIERFDEPHESADPLLAVRFDPGIVADTAKHNCPACTDIVMQRHFFTPRFEIEIDECPGCGGFWLDRDELELIREQFDSAEDRAAAREAFLGENLAQHFRAMEDRESEVQERASFLSRIFAWACPSMLLPGKQSWGNH